LTLAGPGRPEIPAWVIRTDTNRALTWTRMAIVGSAWILR
jgi:hypothetical protein